MSDDWKTIKVRREVVNKTEKFLKTKQAKQAGLTNVSQVYDLAIRDLLAEYEQRRFEHFNFHENIIRVLDNSIGERGDIVELRKQNNSLTCGFCERIDCVHIKFVWSDPDLIYELKKAGLRSPF